MSVWITIPSKKPAPEAQAVIDRWRARGYRVAIWRDSGDAPVDCDLLLTGEYPGYARAVNALALEAVKRGAQWCIVAGDDIDPDPTHDPAEIARECVEHYGGTFGVCQPTGDRWGADRNDPNFCGSAYIDRVAGSAWCGAEFCRRMYGGAGPLCVEYWHMYVDQCLQEVATMMDVFWQRPDLTQRHNHWGRTTGRMPEYLKRANVEFAEAGLLFARQKAAGFPGHEPID
jgi:hypothetical protein